MRVAIISVGAPAGGMNAAIRAVVTRCLSSGHTPVAIHNGFSGLCRHHDDKPLGSVREVSWLDVEGWTSMGGCEIGTNRALPSEDMDTTAHCFERYKFDALFIIGGFEAYTALWEMHQARNKYEAFRIPMVLLPATISNNVPGTEYSIGADTCINALVGYCDTIRQSASSSRRRVFVIETQGGRTGYIATMAGLAVGALAVYTPEEGITLRMINRDIEYLRANFATDRGQNRAGKLILRNETASATYTTELIANMIKEEARGRFEARFAVPGHVQQGGKPSPMDRVRAQRLAVRCVERLQSYAGRSKADIMRDPSSACVIGIKGAGVVFTDMEYLQQHETDWKNRRPLHEFWTSYKDTVDTLSGRPKENQCCGECGKMR